MMIQNEIFLNEKHAELKTLVVFKDQEDVIRLQIKIAYGDGCGDFRKPAILFSQQETVRNLR